MSWPSRYTQRKKKPRAPKSPKEGVDKPEVIQAAATSTSYGGREEGRAQLQKHPFQQCEGKTQL